MINNTDDSYIERIYGDDEDKRELVYILMHDLGGRSREFSHFVILVTTKRELENSYKWIDKTYENEDVMCSEISDFEKALIETCHIFNEERRPPRIIIWHNRMKIKEKTNEAI